MNAVEFDNRGLTGAIICECEKENWVYDITEETKIECECGVKYRISIPIVERDEGWELEGNAEEVARYAEILRRGGGK